MDGNQILMNINEHTKMLHIHLHTFEFFNKKCDDDDEPMENENHDIIAPSTQ